MAMFRNGALALISLVLPMTSLAEHVNCKPGEVAYETVRVGDQDVDLLTAGPDCPESAPRVVSLPPVAVAATPAAAEQAAAELVNDRPEAHAASAGAPIAAGGLSDEETAARFLPWLVAGSVLLFTLSAAYGAHRVYDQKVRQPRQQAEEEEVAKRRAEEEAGADLRAAEEGARGAAEAEDARRPAREAREASAAAQAQEEAERRAWEEAEREAREAAAAAQAQEEAERRAREEAERASRAQELSARERGAEEERRRRQLEEADAAARHPERGAGGGAAKKRCGPIGCGSCGGAPRAAEPGPTGGPNP